MDIFDKIIAEKKDIFDTVLEKKKDIFSKVSKELTPAVRSYIKASQTKPQPSLTMTDVLSAVKDELSKTKVPPQKIVERIIEKVEVKKEKSKDWTIDFDKLKEELSRVRETMMMLGSHGGSGVVGLPTQTGAGGQFLTTNGSSASWKTVVGIEIGMVIPFLKSFTNTPALPSNFVECNGQVLSDNQSVYNGATLPDHNTSNRFIRGNSTSGGTGGTSTHQHSLTTQGVSAVAGGTTMVNFAVTQFASTLPTYYDQVMVMRIK